MTWTSWHFRHTTTIPPATTGTSILSGGCRLSEVASLHQSFHKWISSEMTWTKRIKRKTNYLKTTSRCRIASYKSNEVNKFDLSMMQNKKGKHPVKVSYNLFHVVLKIPSQTLPVPSGCTSAWSNFQAITVFSFYAILVLSMGLFITHHVNGDQKTLVMAICVCIYMYW